MMKRSVPQGNTRGFIVYGPITELHSPEAKTDVEGEEDKSTTIIRDLNIPFSVVDKTKQKSVRI
jgi:hypothetical protein